MRLLGVLLKVSLANLLGSRTSWIVGTILFVGTTFFITVGALIESLDDAMSRSVADSVSGELQVISKDTQGKFNLLPSFGGEPAIAPIEDFAPAAAVLRKVENVREVVPMGVSAATFSPGNAIDVAVESLRELTEAGAPAERTEPVKGRLRHLAQLLQQDLAGASVLLDPETADERRRAVDRAASEAFWRDLDRAPAQALDFIDNEIAPLMTEGSLVDVRYLGTDLTHFGRAFNRLQIKDGQRVPEGKRGLLLSKVFYEDQLKLKTARRLDRLLEATQGGRKIATDDELKLWVRQNRAQVREVVSLLDDARAGLATERLRKELKVEGETLTQLLVRFLGVDDQTLAPRHAFFYAQLAPLLPLYRVKVGELITLRSYSRTGYLNSATVRLYGTFDFRGFESASLMSNFNLIDLVTFRDLYGYPSPAERDELKALKAASGIEAVEPARAEELLFNASAPSGDAPPSFDEKQLLGGLGAPRLRDPDAPFDPSEQTRGLVLNISLRLVDPARAAATLKAVQGALDAAGLNLKVVSWQEASGLMGQLVVVARLVLLGLAFLVFLVAGLVINSAISLGTMQRVGQLGTLRAIGAQRTLVLAMLLTESGLTGVLAGLLGAAASAGLLAWLHSAGIPATDEFTQFAFCGPRLYPDLSPTVTAAGLLVVLVVGVVASLRPGLRAMRISPLTAMQSDE